MDEFSDPPSVASEDLNAQLQWGPFIGLRLYQLRHNLCYSLRAAYIFIFSFLRTSPNRKHMKVIEGAILFFVFPLLLCIFDYLLYLSILRPGIRSEQRSGIRSELPPTNSLECKLQSFLFIFHLLVFCLISTQDDELFSPLPKPRKKLSIGCSLPRFSRQWVIGLTMAQIPVLLTQASVSRHMPMIMLWLDYYIYGLTVFMVSLREFIIFPSSRYAISLREHLLEAGTDYHLACLAKDKGILPAVAYYRGNLDDESKLESGNLRRRTGTKGNVANAPQSSR